MKRFFSFCIALLALSAAMLFGLMVDAMVNPMAADNNLWPIELIIVVFLNSAILLWTANYWFNRALDGMKFINPIQRV